ncbi:MAG: STAS domain-containing protein [Candidatus Gracilibacteria bacterium]|nr:STAS domain-containing protein [Candidatus Gracilibacteria bacterium]
METLIKITKREEEEILIFTFEGELDETNADNTFKDIYEQIGSFENKKIIFNMSGLKYLNSKSIGYIADVFSNIEDNEGEMHISNCDEGVKDVLELVGITTIIPTVDTEEEAIAELK